MFCEHEMCVFTRYTIGKNERLTNTLHVYKHAARVRDILMQTIPEKAYTQSMAASTLSMDGCDRVENYRIKSSTWSRGFAGASGILAARVSM